MLQNLQEHDLKETLSKVETALLTPVVSGELETWIENVGQAAAELGENLKQFIDVVLKKEYKEIGKSDQELLGRVQQMIAEDKALWEQFEEFQHHLQSLAVRVPPGERNELKMEEHRAHVEKLGTALILAIKRHQVTVSTWLTEAVYRDRGPVD